MPEINIKLYLNDRETIQISIVNKQPIKRIAKLLKRHASTIANEIKKHRIFINGSYYAGNDCKYAKGCEVRNVCGDKECAMYCFACPKDCHNFCPEYDTKKCLEYLKPPYVCNACPERRNCVDDRYFYDARVANREALEKRSESRKGIHLTSEELSDLNSLLSVNIRKACAAKEPSLNGKALSVLRVCVAVSKESFFNKIAIILTCHRKIIAK